MKKAVVIVVPLLLILLLMSGCTSNPPTQSPPQSIPSVELSSEPMPQTEVPTPVISSNEPPSASASPAPRELLFGWYYDLKKDGLYRTNPSTGDVIKINGQDYAFDIVITEDWVYYNDNGSLYRMDNENNRELIGDACSRLSLNGDWLYYLSDSGIGRMKPDGSEKEQILECACNDMVVTDEYVFYALDVPEIDELSSEPGAEDGPLYIGELHRVGLNGEGDIKIIDMIIDLSAYENTVYFSDDEDGNFYSMNPETLEKTKIEEIRLVQQSYFDSGCVFLMTNIDRQLYRLSLADGTLTKLTEGFSSQCLGALDGYIYFFDSAGEPGVIYRIRVDGVEIENVE